MLAFQRFIKPTFQWTKARIGVLVTLSIIFFLYFIYLFFGKLAFTNHTESAPTGIYIFSLNQNLFPGDYVTIHSPWSFGDPLNVPVGFPLLKQVRGYPGETYIVTPSEIIISGKHFPIAPDTPQFSYLPRLQPGTYTVPNGSHLYLNDSPVSFDSRYLGPIPDRYIIHKVTLFIDYHAIDVFLSTYLPNFLVLPFISV